MNKRCKIAYGISALLLNLLTPGSALAVLSVGDSLGCQYAKIQDAINAAAANDIIHVEPSHTYSEHLLITDKSLQICASACGQSVCASKIHASVAGSPTSKAHSPLLSVTASGNDSVMVTLSAIDFSNNVSYTNGGGIAWVAPGSLTLNDVRVTGNHAPNGGGVYFNDTSTNAQATLTFGANVSIDNNTATGSGGGMRIEGLSQFYMDGSDDRIFLNTADSDGNDVGDGGGISVVSPANVSISTAVIGNATIYSNTAYNGGGIALIGSSVDSGGNGSGITIVGDLNHPARIESNTATNFGGGIYLRPKAFASSTINSVFLEAYGYRLDTNQAFDGSAIYADSDSASGVDAGGKVTLDAAICRPQVECNTIAGNLSDDAIPIGGSPASVVVIKSNGQLNARAVRMHDNVGEHLLQSSGSKAAVAFSLMYGNHVAGALIEGDSGSQHLQINQCTIAQNTIEGAQVISGSLELLNNSLIDQAGTAAFSGSGTPVAFNVVATDTDGLPSDPSIQQQQPLFVDAAIDDFHLLVQRYDDGTVTASPGVDYATAGISQLDIDGRPYDQDIPGIGAAGNVHDLGAFEMQPFADRIFASGIGDPMMLAY